MEVTVSSNGKLTLSIASPKPGVQAAALKAFQQAISKGQQVEVTATAEAR